jgi:hypothetical protein
MLLTPQSWDIDFGMGKGTASRPSRGQLSGQPAKCRKGVVFGARAPDTEQA